MGSVKESYDLIINDIVDGVTRTIEERHEHYKEVLVKSCASAAKACPRVIFLSSFSVYGDGGQEPGPVTESTPTRRSPAWSGRQT